MEILTLKQLACCSPMPVSEILLFQNLDVGISPCISEISNFPKKDAGSGPETYTNWNGISQQVRFHIRLQVAARDDKWAWLCAL